MSIGWVLPFCYASMPTCGMILGILREGKKPGYSSEVDG